VSLSLLRFARLQLARITFADNSQGKEVSCTENIDDASFQNIQNAKKQLTSRLPDGNQLSIISFEKKPKHMN